MISTIDMQHIRYLNLFSKITKINTRFCLNYNNALVFCVPKKLVAKAVGEGGKNIKQISQILRKKIKVVAVPEGIKDAKVFIQAVVSPFEFRNLELNGNEIVLTAGMSKAALLGRNKRRLIEMQKIVRGFFGKEFRII